MKNRLVRICTASPKAWLVLGSLLLPAPTATAGPLALQCSPAELTAPGGVHGDSFGGATAIDGRILVAGASGDDAGAAQAGAVQVFIRTVSGWQFSASLTASDPRAFAYFGRALAMDESTLIVGAPGADGTTLGSGAVYIFQQTTTGWIESAKLVPSDGLLGDHFGASVALSGDLLLVGAPASGSAGSGAAGMASGKAYAFEHSGGLWQENAILLAPTPAAGERFGAAVALQGHQALIGAPGDRAEGVGAGSVTHWSYDGIGSWSQWGDLTGWAQPHDAFGSAIAMDAEEGYAIAGAPGDALASSGGRALPLVLSKSGYSFDIARGPLDPGLAPGSLFGFSVAIDVDSSSGEWKYAAGAPLADGSQGRVTAYEWLNDWTETASIRPAVSQGSAGGSACAMEDSTLVAGVPESAAGGLLLICDDLPDLDCGESYLYCPAAINSTGNGADIVSSMHFPGYGQVTLFAREVPALVSGIFLTGEGEAQLPFGDGFLCIDPSIGLTRLGPPLVTDISGQASKVIDLDPPPLAGLFVAFSTWKFQFWFRDPAGPGGSGFNTSNALSLTFCPL